MLYDDFYPYLQLFIHMIAWYQISVSFLKLNSNPCSYTLIMDPFKQSKNEILGQGAEDSDLPLPWLDTQRKVDADQFWHLLVNLSSSRAGKQSNTGIIQIKTPANNSKNSYLDQLDERDQQQKKREIYKVLQLNNGEEKDVDDEDSQSDYDEIQQSDNESDSPEPEGSQGRKWVVESIVRQNQQENKELFQEKTPSVTDTREKIKKIPVSSIAVKKTITCNCKKTQCLKLYCDCFRDNEICGEGCNCQGCQNTSQNEYKRRKIMLELRQRNPEAFKPKIIQEQHSKGCQCKKSHCQKKYCECYQAGLKCGHNCKCEQCRNVRTSSCYHDEEKNLKTAVKRQKKVLIS